MAKSKRLKWPEEPMIRLDKGFSRWKAENGDYSVVHRGEQKTYEAWCGYVVIKAIRPITSLSAAKRACQRHYERNPQ